MPVGRVEAALLGQPVADLAAQALNQTMVHAVTAAPARR